MYQDGTLSNQLPVQGFKATFRCVPFCLNVTLDVHSSLVGHCPAEERGQKQRERDCSPSLGFGSEWFPRNLLGVFENHVFFMCYFPCQHMNNGNRTHTLHVHPFNTLSWEKTATQRNLITC